MKNDIFDLKVTMNERSTTFWLVVRVREELNHFFHARDLSNRFVGINIDCPTLRLLGDFQILEPTSVEATSMAKAIQAHYIDVDSVEFRQCCDDFTPPRLIYKLHVRIKWSFQGVKNL